MTVEEHKSTEHVVSTSVPATETSSEKTAPITENVSPVEEPLVPNKAHISELIKKYEALGDAAATPQEAHPHYLAAKQLLQSALQPAPYDPRFPFTNQSARCWQSFVDYHKCQRKKGDDPVCERFKRIYKEICPLRWVEHWQEALEEERLPVDWEEKTGAHH